MTYTPRWLRDHRVDEETWKAQQKALRCWQAWCPFCEEEVEHSYAPPLNQRNPNTHVRCAKGHLHAGLAKRPS